MTPEELGAWQRQQSEAVLRQVEYARGYQEGRLAEARYLKEELSRGPWWHFREWLGLRIGQLAMWIRPKR